MKTVLPLPGMRYLLILSILTNIQTKSAFAQENLDKYISVQSLNSKGFISTELKSLGGHTSDCIELELQSHSDDSQYCWIEPGRRLVSRDTNEQDILIVKQYLIPLGPRQKITLRLFGFCCESTMATPKPNSKFSLGHMAPAEWIQLAVFISQNSFPASAIQSAVWVLSNHHELGSIHYSDFKAIYPLRAELARILNEPIPWYYITYEHDDTLVFSGRHETVYGDITFESRNNGVATIHVRDGKGRLMAMINQGSAVGPGEHRYPLTLDVRGWPKGEYRVVVTEDYSNMIARYVFRL
jgi:hypothetical protein